MPVKKSAFKELRKGSRRADRNRAANFELKYLLKKIRQAVEKKDTKAAEDFFKQAIQRLDKMAQKGMMHRNTAARKKSRLSKKIKLHR